MSALPAVQAASPTLPPTPTYSPPAKGATPLPCTPGTCGKSPGAPTTWLGSGAATFTVVGSTLTVTQTSASAALNWSNFDIGANASVAFNQPSTTTIALNRIFQSVPSQIFGALQSNGQVYLINQNGFVFGRTATVNVGGLLASSLNIDPLAAQKGILDPGLLSNGLPALASDGRAGVTALDGTPLLGPDGMPLPIEIVVQPGAQIATNAANQRLLLASRSIDNAGTLTAPGGQVVLAAGEKVYLTASIDPNLRGLIVEVDGGGVATNAATGTLSASVGNISVVGLAVNQLGRVSATTSVTENGSVYLKAQDTVQVLQDGSTFQLNARRGGAATLGAGSITEVLPDVSAGTTVDAVAQPVSTIAVSGQGVYFEGGSTTHAPGGSVIVNAAQNPSGTTTGTTEAASIRVNSGAVIDVSGSAASVPVTRNIIEVALNSSELADDPQQRNGFLYRQNVFVDARLGTPLANVSGSVALIERGIGERTAAGGTVALNSSGDVVIANGATVDVSGGAVTYTPGYVQTTKLVTSTGSVVDIGSASPSATYVGIFNPTLQQVSDRWGVVTEVSTPGVGKYDPGYVQGANAGTVSISAPGAIVLQGTLLGATVAGINQRTSSTLPQGGQLVIGQPGAALDARAPAVEIVTTPTPITVADGTPLPAPLPLELPLQSILDDGFNRVAIASNTSVKLDPGTPLTLGAGGSFAAAAPRVEIDSSVTAPGGTLTVASLTPTTVPAPPLASRGVYVGDGVTFGASGNWTNDALLPPGAVAVGPVLLKGGSVSLDAGGATLSLGNDVTFDVSGGAWLVRNGKLTPGTGGSVSLVEGPAGTTSLGDGIRFAAFGVEGAAGGSLVFSAPRMQVNTAAGPWATAQTVSADPKDSAVLNLNASLLSDFGFSSIALTADGRRVALDPSAVTLSVVATPGSPGLLQMRPETYPVTSALYQVASAATVASIEAPAATPAYRATPATLSLTAALASGAPWVATDIGGISIGPGSHIDVGAGGSVRLASVGSTSIQGAISAPGGSISVETLTPQVSFDPGFVATQRIEVAPGALLDVSGTVVYTPNSSGLYTGTLYNGGTIDLRADRGSIVVDGGAVLDFAGTQALLDVRTPALGSAPVRETLASAGGTLTVTAPESISLLGTLEGAAGQGSSGTAAGGTLSVSLSRVDGFVSNNNPFPATPRTIVLETGAPPIIQAGDSGTAIIDPRQIAASGVDALRTSADQIELADGVAVSFGREVILQTAAILVPGTASVTAPYVSLGAGSTLLQSRTATPGTGSLLVTGTESLNVAGNLSFLGAGAVTLATSGVLSLSGNYNTGTLPAPATLSIAGNLVVSATAVEPATATSYTISALSGDRQNPYGVAFEQAGPAPATPLSAASALTVNADVITQGGTLLAPFGTITLNGTQSVTLVAGSVTSVSGSGATLPYGIVEGGNQWVYGTVESLAQPIAGIPARQLTLNAPAVTIAKGSTVDISGGGDLYAYEWIPGPGGTKDALSPTVSPGLYAVIPSTAGQFAPYDPLQYQNSTLTPGRSVYLAGGSGVPAGFYPLLPARYALLPGAVLISVAPGYANLPPGATATAPDGAPIVSGYFTFGNTGLGSNQTQGFVIEPGSYAHRLADYHDNLASTFFAAAATRAGLPAPVLPADAGALAIQTATLLAAGGTVNAAGASGGSGGLVELATPSSIIVVASGAAAPPTAGVVTVGADVLESWKPGQLLLGGVYTDPNTIDVVTGSIAVESGAALTASEVVLVAANSIGIANGASVRSTSADASAPVAGLAPKTLTLTGSGASGAALLGVSDLANLEPAHPARPSGGTNVGVVTLAAGSTVSSRGSVALDAPGGAGIADGSVSGAGAAWSIGGASSVIFGSSAPPGTPAGSLLIDPALAAALSAGQSVRIATAGSIEFNGSLSFGGGAAAPLENVTLIASELRDAGAAGSVRFSANTITLGGQGSAALDAATGSDTLEFDAGSLTVGPGTLVANGFGTVTLSATQSVLASGAGGLTASGNLAINAGYVTAASNSHVTLGAAGVLTLGAGGAEPAPGRSPLGGTLALAGQSIVDDGTIVAPSGVVSLASRSTVELGSTAVIDVGGSALAGAASGYGTQGGLIAVTAAGGVTQAQGSRLAVGGGPGADAGVVSIAAGGTVGLGGTLDASAAGGNPRSASFYLTAGSVTDFAGLNAALETGGFDSTRSIRVVAGDLVLGPQATLTARNVLLEADAGSISVAGRINASGAGARSIVELDAGRGLSVAGTAVIEADAADANTKGGSITLSTAAGLLSVDPAATITARGGAATAAPSELVLRAPALATDVAISTLPANTSAVGRVVIEPWSVFALSSGTPTAAEFNNGAATVAAYVAAATGPISQRLGLGANAAIAPFIEFTYPGDVTLGSLELNSAAWRFGGQPATVAIAAAGNLKVNGTISDGFTRVPGSDWPTPKLDLGTTASSTIVLTAGAAPGAAVPTATAADSAADLTLAARSIVRSGTGDITLTAARDVAFGSGAAVYTGGLGEALTINLPGGSDVLPPVFATFPTAGGSVSVTAGRDVIAAPVKGSVSDWQSRLQLSSSGAASWGTDAANFNWTLGALGGGDVTVRAGRNVDDLAAAAADNALSDANGQNLTYYGAGNLSVQSGRDIISGLFYVGRGTGTLNAFGALSSDRVDPTSKTGDVGTLLLSGDASYRVSAVGNVIFEGDVPASAMYAGTTLPELDFFRLTPSDSLSVTSAGGDFKLRLANAALTSVIGTAAFYQTGLVILGTLPASTSLIAASGNLAIERGNPLLLPSDRGQLLLYAGQNLTAPGKNTSVAMSDSPDSLLPTAASPYLLGLPVDPALLTAGQSARHTGDPNPVIVYAGQDIGAMSLSVPKAVDIYAGHNITDLVLFATNTNSTDISVEAAGGSILTTFANLNSGSQIAGGGSFDLIAGRNIDLGFSRGVTTVGNLTNPYLTTTSGANVTVLPGLGAPLGVDAPGGGAHSDFVANVIEASLDPTTGKPLYQQQLINYVTALGFAPADLAAAANDFRGLALTQQLPLLSSVLFQELVRSGREYNTLPVPEGTASGSSGQIGGALNQSNLEKLINNIIAPSPVYQQQLVSYVEGATGKSGLSYEQALADFEQFPAALQVAFRYVRGYTAVEELFPGTNPFDALINHVVSTDPTIVAENGAAAGGSKPFPGVADIPPNPYQGDFSMTLGRLYTLDGGTISVLAPGGSVNVGLATTPPSVSQQGVVRKPSDLGIVTEKAGNVDILTEGDVLVNSSRVFTLGGGDIAIWSSAGSIDAGRGAKSAISSPPPVVTVDASGQVSVSFGAAVAGSGIRTIITDPSLPPGNVDLVAPLGTVNAGDAGIGAAGNLNIAAASVAGLNNITAGGTSTGVPAVASGVGVTVASAANAASSSTASSTSSVAPANETREQAAPLSSAAISWLEVFVIGLGEESCRPDDLDCLKRQPKH